MATRFVQQAQSQLDPLFKQQSAAVQQQIPAIEQLYQSLTQGLEAQGRVEGQNILESASARGVLRSSLPVDTQTSLGQSLLQARGQLGSEQAREVAGVRKSLADIGLQRTQSISSLADLLQTRSLREREFKLQQMQADRQFQLEKQKIALARTQANSSSAINGLISKIGKNSGLGGNITFDDIVEFLSEFREGGGLTGGGKVKFGQNAPLNLNAAKSSGGLRF